MMRTTKADLEVSLQQSVTVNNKLREELINLDRRIKDIAAENESLRADKKWLQQMHSNLLQNLLANKLS